MKNINVTEEVKAKIEAFQKQRTIDLLDLNAKIDDAKKHEQEAKEAMKKATEVTDLNAYAIAKNKMTESTTAVEMYEARYKQLKEREFVTEEESDGVIKSLLDYEDLLSSEYETKVGAILQDLLKVTTDYKKGISDTESVITRWTSSVHANYRSKHTRYPNGTNRSDNPVPVHASPYLGSDLSERVYYFLKNEDLYPQQ